MRLIDADALMKTLGIAQECENCVYQAGALCGQSKNFADACKTIRNAPTIEPNGRRGSGYIINTGRTMASVGMNVLSVVGAWIMI